MERLQQRYNSGKLSLINKSLRERKNSAFCHMLDTKKIQKRKKFYLLLDNEIFCGIYDTDLKISVTLLPLKVNRISNDLLGCSEDFKSNLDTIILVKNFNLFAAYGLSLNLELFYQNFQDEIFTEDRITPAHICIESKDDNMSKQNELLTKSEFMEILNTFPEKERHEILVEKLNLDHEYKMDKDKNYLIGGIFFLIMLYFIVSLFF